MGNAKHPLPTEYFIVLGRKYLFAYPISHLCLLGFTFMYINVNTYTRFKIYSSLMTGNTVNATLSLKDAEFDDTLFKFVIIVAHVIGGTGLNCCLMEYFQSREYAFGALMLALCIACGLVDWMESYKHTKDNYIVCLVTFVCGALAHWSSKLGYVAVLHTGNLFKLGESLWLLLNGYSLGSAKARGDALMLFFLVLSSLAGAVLASIALVYVPEVSLVLVLATVPLHLHLSGTTAVWGFPLYSITDYLFRRTLHHARSSLHLDHILPPGDCPPSLRDCHKPVVSPRSSLGSPPDVGEDPPEEPTAATATVGSLALPSLPSLPLGSVSGKFHFFKRKEITAQELRKFQDTLSPPSSPRESRGSDMV